MSGSDTLLAQAKALLAESDSLREAGEDRYLRAAEAITEAMQADPSLSFREVGRRIGRGHVWVSEVVRWVTSGCDRTKSPFSGKHNRASLDRAAVRRLRRDDPEALYDEVMSDPDAARQFAEEILARLALADEPADPQPNPEQPQDDPVDTESRAAVPCATTDEKVYGPDDYEIVGPGEYEAWQARKAEEALRAMEFLNAFGSTTPPPPDPEWEEEMRRQRADARAFRARIQREAEERHQPIGRIREIVQACRRAVDEALRFDLDSPIPIPPEEREQFARILKQAFVVIRRVLSLVGEEPQPC